MTGLIVRRNVKSFLLFSFDCELLVAVVFLGMNLVTAVGVDFNGAWSSQVGDRKRTQKCHKKHVTCKTQYFMHH